MTASYTQPAAAAPPDSSSTVTRMKAAKRWLIYRTVPRPGTDKVDKLPHYINGSPRRGKADDPSHRANLSTFDKAKEAVATRGQDWGLGFELGDDGKGGNWQGIDFDDVDENELAELVDELPGYVEKSPSGKGVHAIGYGRAFKSLGSNGSGIEAYASGRFFTVSGKRPRDAPVDCLADFVEKRLAPLHSSMRAPVAGAAAAQPVQAVAAQTIAELRSALNHLRSDDYARWVNIGLALKTLGDVGRGLWLNWSAASSKFDPRLAAEKWESFDPQQTTYRTVFSEAQASGWINPASNAAKLNGAAGGSPRPDPEAVSPRIAATPFIAPVLADIPPRPWLFGRWVLRGTVTAVIAPGGAGKSALMVATALSLASGRDFLGKTVCGGPKRVWLWNLEDDSEELARQVSACASHHGISGPDCQERLFVNGAEMSLCLATKGRVGLIEEASVVALTQAIRESGVDTLIIDPFVSSHRVDENDNGQIDAVVKTLAAIARDTGCAVVLVHHSRKLYGQAVDADASRGASALTNATRTVLGLNRMEKGEAGRFGISEADRWRYVRVGNEKANRAPAGESDWFQLVSVNLGNGGPHGGDQVGVIARWTPPNPALEACAITQSVRARIQVRVGSGEWRASRSAADWAGKAISEEIGADLDSVERIASVTNLLKDMLNKGQLRIEKRADASRHVRPFVVAGERIEADCDSPMW